MMVAKKRDVTIDAAKGLLIMMVVYAHCFTDGVIHDFIFAFHMPAFLVISGMTACLSRELDVPLRETLLKLLRTIGIPFVFFELLGVAQELIRCGFTLSWKGFLFNSLTMRCNNIVDWFLYALLVAKLLSACVRKLLLRMLEKKVADAIYLAASVLVMITAVMLADNASVMMGVILKIAIAHGFYAIGLSVSGCDVGKKYWIGGICLAAVFLLSMLNDGYADMNELHFGNPVIFFAAALLGTGGILQLRSLYTWKPLVWFGQNSLLVMGTHIPILLLTRFITNTTKPTLLQRIGDMTMILVLMVPLVYLFKNYAPVLIGRGRDNFQNA